MMRAVAMHPTLPLYDRLIPGGLEQLLLDARGRGESYNTIARNLAAEHGIGVTPPTIASWCKSFDIAKADA